ncbi:hypothetical protein BLOT_013319, partial [Blomia tropicalis]
QKSDLILKQFIPNKTLSFMTNYLDGFVFAFNTKKKYGFTYYKIAIINMFSFQKYLFLYSKLMMIGIGFIKKSQIKTE